MSREADYITEVTDVQGSWLHHRSYRCPGKLTFPELRQTNAGPVSEIYLRVYTFAEYCKILYN
jgi:hypothetical protein